MARVQRIAAESLQTDVAEVPRASARRAQAVALLGPERLACALKIMASFEEEGPWEVGLRGEGGAIGVGCGWSLEGYVLIAMGRG